MTIGEKWIVAAVLLGPVLGVMLTYLMQHIVTKRQRRMDVFRALMQTRKMRLSQSHVEALNLVEVEFYRKKDVIKKWNSYLEHLYTKAPEDKDERERFYKEQDKRLTLLVQSIGNVMGRKIEQFDIWEGGYVPVGWEQDDVQARLLRHYALNMLRGQQGLPVIVHRPSGVTGDQYPPPPD